MSRTKKLSISYLITYPIAFIVTVVLLVLYGRQLLDFAQQKEGFTGNLALWTVYLLYAVVIVVPFIMLIINILLIFFNVGTIARILLIVGLFVPWCSFVGALIALIRSGK
ncbi:hypothetical protein FCM51_01595 [Mycoplasma bovis]|nr:hypothetical protein [Mycoplasmopsis bovis]